MARWRNMYSCSATAGLPAGTSTPVLVESLSRAVAGALSKPASVSPSIASSSSACGIRSTQPRGVSAKATATRVSDRNRPCRSAWFSVGVDPPCSALRCAPDKNCQTTALYSPVRVCGRSGCRPPAPAAQRADQREQQRDPAHPCERGVTHSLEESGGDMCGQVPCPHRFFCVRGGEGRSSGPPVHQVPGARCIRPADCSR